MPGLSYHTWDLVPWPGIEPGRPALGAQSLSHWTTREVPLSACLGGNLNSLYEGPPSSSSGPPLHHYLIPLPLFSCSRDRLFSRATHGQFGFSFTVEVLDLNSPFFDQTSYPSCLLPPPAVTPPYVLQALSLSPIHSVAIPPPVLASCPAKTTLRN